MFHTTLLNVHFNKSSLERTDNSLAWWKREKIHIAYFLVTKWQENSFEKQIQAYTAKIISKAGNTYEYII